MLQDIATLTSVTLLHGTILALTTWLVCATLLRRARPAIIGVLWTIVLLKFMVPPVFPGEMALSGFLSRAFLGAGHEAPASEPPGATVEAMIPNGSGEPESGAAPIQLLAIAWGMAVLLLSMRFAVHATGDWRRFRRLPEASPEALSEVRRLCHLMGIRRLPRVVATPAGSSPFVTGFVAPTLALPETMLARLQPAARQALILHELAHIRRGDLFIRALQNGARILLFFWPPVWWVCRRIERSAEMACDQWAVAVSRIEPHVYAGSLLEVVKSITVTRRTRGQLAFARQGRLLEERFEMILKRNKGVSPRLSWLAIPALALWATFALAGGQAGQASAEKKEKKPVRVIVKSSDKRPTVVDFTKDADLDGDGVISEQEIEDFKLIHPELAEHKIRVHLASAEDDSASFVWEEAVDKILELHPDADTNHDGILTEDEAKAFAKTMPGPEDGRVAYFFSATADSEDGLTKVEVKREPNVIFIRRDGATDQIAADAEGEWTTKSGDRIIVRHGDSDALKELDTDGDGDVSLEEANAYAAAHGGEDGKQTVFFLQRVPDEGLHELTEAEALGRGEKLAQARRENLLRKHPEADLDGDGVISQEEAKALAAKLQAKSKKP